MQTCKIALVKLENKIKNQSNLFWLFHLGGWALWGIVGKYLYTATMLEDVAPGYAAYVAIISVIGLFISLALRYLYRFLWERAIWIQAIGLLAGSGLTGFLWLKARGYIYYGWIETAKDMEAWYEKLGDAAEIYSKVSFVESNTGSIMVMLAWSALYSAIKSYRVFQEIRESALKSAAMAHEAQLKICVTN